MSKGKNLERIGRIVQEAFKSFPKTVIHSNYKIPNTSGRKREIDILIVSEVNGYEIKIAIECKDYGRKVSVEKVEAFHGKCQRIKGLNKKAMISSNGFQKDAVNAANDFDIDVFELKDISSEVVLNWIDTRQIKQLYTTMKLEPSTIKVIGDESDSENMPELKDNLMAHFVTDDPPRPLINLVIENVNQNKKFIHSYTVSGFFMDKEKKLPRTERIPFEIDLKGVFVIGRDNRKFPVTKISSAVHATLNERDSNIEEIRRYENYTSKINKAEVVSIKTGCEGKLELVNKTENGEISFFHTDKDGQIKRLETLATYDPKKDKWDFKNKEEKKAGENKS